ncbi:hypothetical protein Taro_053531 [Colocasia esculenta]|uniref:Uncharacterized protein n=1 Tax=Colocasia esculenta TaxID=4460 RepID=A0A843XN29_COLES|nr:hypothetical protein [Colocasia esculenta]
MGGEGAQLDPVDCDSLLPPRKRLLAGLKRQNSDCSALLSVNSDELRARLQGLLNSTDLSPEEIVEAAKAESLAATEAAANAKAVAMEKAIVAANARSLAKSLLEVVMASAETDENPMKSHPKKKRTKKELVPVEKDENSKNHHPKKKKTQKHVPVELLYRSGGPVPTSETDEELARRLHRAMNSSSRISTRLNKKSEAVRATGNSDGVAVCIGNPTSPDDGSVVSGEGNYVEKSGGRVAVGSRADCPEKVVGAGDPLENPKSVWKGVAHGRRGSRRQKKLPLSQCCLRAQENAREIAPLEDHPPIGEPKRDTTGDVHAPPRRASKEEHAALEAKPVWKCKKFRVSRCHSAGPLRHLKGPNSCLWTPHSLFEQDVTFWTDCVPLARTSCNLPPEGVEHRAALSSAEHRAAWAKQAHAQRPFVCGPKRSFAYPRRLIRRRITCPTVKGINYEESQQTPQTNSSPLRDSNRRVPSVIIEGDCGWSLHLPCL